MTVHFMAEHNAAMHTGRIVAMQERVLTIDEFEPRFRRKGIPYAAIDFGSTDQGDEVEILDASSPPRSSPGGLSRLARFLRPAAPRRRSLKLRYSSRWPTQAVGANLPLPTNGKLGNRACRNDLPGHNLTFAISNRPPES